MSIFAPIEAHLVQFAAQQGAVVTRDRDGDSLRPSGPDHSSFEERRLDWQRDGFRLAVIIQPTFAGLGVDSSQWNMYTIAWQDGANGRRVAGQDLAREVPFEQIAAHIEVLLAQARAHLNGLRRGDLKRQVNVGLQRELRRQQEQQGSDPGPASLPQ